MPTLVAKTFRLWTMGALCALFALGICLKVFQDVDRSKKHGDLVAKIVASQVDILKNESVTDQALEQIPALPDDSLQLESWLIARLMRDRDPLQVSRYLEEMTAKSSLSMNLRVSLARWKEALSRWAYWLQNESQFSAEDLLREGRIIHAEASGYRKIGKSYDAVPLYVWSIYVLASFVERFSYDEQVPEALFLLGDSYFRLRLALPAQVRSDRILNLCPEFYPHSVWANQSNSLWRSEMSYGI